MQHEERFTTTIGAIGRCVIIELIAHHLWIALHAHDNLRLVGQYRMVEILCYRTNGIYQRTVVRVVMSDTYMAFASNLNRLTHRVLIAKQALGQSLRNYTFIGLIKRGTPVALRELIVEETEESRIGQQDGTLVVAIFHHSLAIFYLSTLTHHAARLLHLRAHCLDIGGCLRPHKEIILTTYQNNLVGMLVPRVDRKLAPRIVAHQDDEHQRHHQTRYIN